MTKGSNIPVWLAKWFWPVFFHRLLRLVKLTAYFLQPCAGFPAREDFPELAIIMIGPGGLL